MNLIEVLYNRPAIALEMEFSVLRALLMVMKKEIVEYIEKLVTEGKPLTDSQARTVAYWELVAFQLEGYCEVFALV